MGEKPTFLNLLCLGFKQYAGTYPTMTVTTLESEGDRVRFCLAGKCPHCLNDVGCAMVTAPYEEQITPGPLNISAAKRFAAVMQCPVCKKYVLAVVTRAAAPPGQTPTDPFKYEAHYPVDKTNDSVDPRVPAEISGPFQEALRCNGARAWQATVLMCRRALQVSCDKELLEAGGEAASEAERKRNSRRDLFDQIDALKNAGRITEPLRNLAHQIRLLGKRGARSDYSDLDQSIGEKDASAAITFMKHYLDHVYIFPAKVELALLPSSQPVPNNQ